MQAAKAFLERPIEEELTQAEVESWIRKNTIPQYKWTAKMKQKFTEYKSARSGIYEFCCMCRHCNCYKRFRFGECVIMDTGLHGLFGSKIYQMHQHMYCVDCGKIGGPMPLEIGFNSMC